MNPIFLSIQGSYQQLYMALYEGEMCRTQIVEHDIKASAQFIPLLDYLLHSNNMHVANLSFIALDQGPGAFTSLRVSVVTANALSFAQHVPLIGVHGLETLAEQVINSYFTLYDVPPVDIVIPMLNAYTDQIYWNAYRFDTPTSSACAILKDSVGSVGQAIKTMAHTFADKTILFCGNGALLYQEDLEHTFGQRAIVHVEDDSLVCSTRAIAQKALLQWKQGNEPIYKVSPLYFRREVATGPSRNRQI